MAGIRASWSGRTLKWPEVPKWTAAVGAGADRFDIFTAAIEAAACGWRACGPFAGPEAFNGIVTGREPVLESFDLGGEQSGSWVVSMLIFAMRRHSGSRLDWWPVVRVRLRGGFDWQNHGSLPIKQRRRLQWPQHRRGGIAETVY